MNEEELLERIRLLEEKVAEQTKLLKSVEAWLMMMVTGHKDYQGSK
jgi:hypothetical protein